MHPRQGRAATRTRAAIGQIETGAMTEQDQPEPSPGFQTFEAVADAAQTGRHRRVAADVADLRALAAPATAPTGDDAERGLVEDLLRECGINPRPELLDKLDGIINRLAFTRAAETLRHVVRSLEATPAGRALERALLGDDGRSLAAAAKEVGCSRQNIHHHEKKVAARLRHLTAGTHL